MIIETGGFLWSLIKENATPQNDKKAKAVMPPPVPKEFEKLFQNSKVEFKYITDDVPGVLFLSDNGFYKCLDMILDDNEFTVVTSMTAGLILPSKAEAGRRWLICCCKTENWERLRPMINARLNFLQKDRLVWRNLNETIVQNDGLKFCCPENVIFKICRVSGV